MLAIETIVRAESYRRREYASRDVVRLMVKEIGQVTIFKRGERRGEWHEYDSYSGA
jgi:hypothetical protein